MNHVYVIWENSTGNAIGEFETDIEAFAYVRKAVAAAGREMCSTLLLTRELDDEDATSEFVGEGFQLIEKALASDLAARSQVPDGRSIRPWVLLMPHASRLTPR